LKLLSNLLLDLVVLGNTFVDADALALIEVTVSRVPPADALGVA
jgi:hypothetical protein